jgi:HlyD family secretion protein
MTSIHRDHTRRCGVRHLLLAACLLSCGACNRSAVTVTHAAAGAQPAAPSDRLKREVRVTGTVQAVHSSKILIPQIQGNYSSMTLTHIMDNGATVKEGDVIATFDSTNMMDAARDAKGRFDDFGHQVDQKRAQNRADAERRASDLKQAQADLAVATQELRKGPVLSEIDRLKTEQRAAIARIHVESLTKSQALHDSADAASLRVLELQRERQKVAMERAQTNIDKLTLKAPLSGMLAQEQISRSDTMGHPQEGDQLFRGQALVSIFDPTEMQVRCSVGEPDVAALVAGVKAIVHLDAYPDIALPAHFDYASPVAASGFGSPIKSFTAVFHIDKRDPHLLPDLSAAVVIQQPGGGAQ